MKTKQKIIDFEGQEVLIIRKNIKNLYLNILNPSGLIRISAPYYIKDSVVYDFLKKRVKWISKNQNIIRNRKKEDFLYKTGEICYFLGSKYRLEIVKDNNEGINIVGNKIMLFVKDVFIKNKRELVILSWQKKELQNFIDNNKEKWEKIIGKKANEWRIRRMKTRWGSCNSSAKRIWISLDIIKKPKECIEYIMVHELLHFLERKHNKKFYKLLNYYYPYYKEAEKMLKK